MSHSSTQPPPFMFPTAILNRLERAKDKYTIRPYHPKDHKSACRIFSEGMLDYYINGSNIRTPLPSLDQVHTKILNKTEEPWAMIFGPYVDYSLNDPNMSDLENYWGLPRRSCFLVAIDNETGEVAGTVAIQPATILDDDSMVSQHVYNMRSDIKVNELIENKYNNGKELIKNNNKLDEPDENVKMNENIMQSLPNNRNEHNQPPTHSQPLLTLDTSVDNTQDKCAIHSREHYKTEYGPGDAFYSQFLTLCHYGTGALPSDFYRLDDPTYDPQTFIQLPTVILPDGAIPEIGGRIESGKDAEDDKLVQSAIPHFIPRPISMATCQCRKNGSGCLSQRTAIKSSRMTTQKRIEYLARVIGDDNAIVVSTNDMWLAGNESSGISTDMSSPGEIHPISDNISDNSILPDVFKSLFCPCARNADKIMVNITNQAIKSSLPYQPIIQNAEGDDENALKFDHFNGFYPTFNIPSTDPQCADGLPCPYCISDAQYLLNVYTPLSERDSVDKVGKIFNPTTPQPNSPTSPLTPTIDNTTTGQRYAINPCLAKYQNCFTSSQILPLTSTSLSQTEQSFVSPENHVFSSDFASALEESVSSASDLLKFSESLESLKLSKPSDLLESSETLFKSSEVFPLTHKLPFWKRIPNGFYRRFQYRSYLDNLFANSVNSINSIESIDTIDNSPNNSPCDLVVADSATNQAPFNTKFPSTLPLSLTPTTYLDFLLERGTKYNGEKNCEENGEENCEKDFPSTPNQELYKNLITSTLTKPHLFYANHTTITPSLQQGSPFIVSTPNQLAIVSKPNPNTSTTTATTAKSSTLASNTQETLHIILPYGDCAEFRRMSVERTHRSSGLGYLLFATALEVASTILKFKSLHLSTSRLMDMACIFYHKVGCREALSQMQPDHEQFACPWDHFAWDLVPRVPQGITDAFGYEYIDIVCGGKTGEDDHDDEGKEVQESDLQNKETIKNAIFYHSNTLPGDRFVQVAQVGDTFLSRGLQQNLKLQEISTKLRQWEAERLE